MPSTHNKTDEQAQLFANRLIKRKRHLGKWAKRNGISCFRLYDKDIPEIPVCVDIYESDEHLRYAVFFLYERPYEKSLEEENHWVDCMTKVTATILDIPHTHIFTKVRRHQRLTQYEKNDKAHYITISENNLQFAVNLSSYVDTGFFLDHRPLRSTVHEQSAGKTVLNLFCYTGSFSVNAASGGAARVHSVDLSKNYLLWAQKNLTLNGFTDKNKYFFINEDVFTFLKHTRNTWDIIILDPPTFSNSKKTTTVLDINRDWQILTELCLNVLNPGGILYFSSNSKQLKFDKTKAEKPGITVKDITQATIPEDFKNVKIHRCWQITRDNHNSV